jgi:hypothetical protein
VSLWHSPPPSPSHHSLQIYSFQFTIPLPLPPLTSCYIHSLMPFHFQNINTASKIIFKATFELFLFPIIITPWSPRLPFPALIHFARARFITINRPCPQYAWIGFVVEEWHKLEQRLSQHCPSKRTWKILLYFVTQMSSTRVVLFQFSVAHAS